MSIIHYGNKALVIEFDSHSVFLRFIGKGQSGWYDMDKLLGNMHVKFPVEMLPFDEHIELSCGM